jgi:hypothetical protein
MLSQESIERAVPGAIRRAAAVVDPRAGQGWTVRIRSGDALREVRLGSQAQVACLALELERLGFVLQVEGADEDADFVFERAAMTAATG